MLPIANIILYCILLHTILLAIIHLIDLKWIYYGYCFKEVIWMVVCVLLAAPRSVYDCGFHWMVESHRKY